MQIIIKYDKLQNTYKYYTNQFSILYLKHNIFMFIYYIRIPVIVRTFEVYTNITQLYIGIIYIVNCKL